MGRGFLAREVYPEVLMSFISTPSTAPSLRGRLQKARKYYNRTHFNALKRGGNMEILLLISVFLLGVLVGAAVLFLVGRYLAKKKMEEMMEGLPALMATLNQLDARR